MNRLNNRDQSRPVTYSHYTKSKRTDTESNTKQSRDALDENKASDKSKRKSVRHSTFATYFANHLWALVSTLGGLYRAPLSTIMTTTVIGIALALPAALFVLLQNVQQLSSNWDSGAHISLYLKSTVNDTQADELLAQLRSDPQIEDVTYISAEQALAEFRQNAGFDNALLLLDENPLPSVLVITLLDRYPDKTAVAELVNDLGGLDQVDSAKLDMQWLARLNGMIQIGQRSLLIVAAMLGLAILVIVGNTIRLTIQTRRQEIEVSKLIGATNGFIQRPFLYGGIWYGFMGGALAVTLIAASLLWLREPVESLSSLYNSDFTLLGLGVSESLSLIGLGIMLGWLGSWLSVHRHLREIEPK